MKTKDIQFIVGEQHLDAWLALNPTVYYRGKLPYGLLTSVKKDDGVTYIASTTANPRLPFTKNMIRDIIRLYETTSMCLICDNPDSWGKLASALSRYGFDYHYVDGVMYAYHIKDSYET